MLTKQQKALAKRILGVSVHFSDYANIATWSKYRGYADKKLTLIREKLAANGFVEYTQRLTGTADGSYMGNVKTFANPAGVIVKLSASYGNTKDDNSFYCEMLFPME